MTIGKQELETIRAYAIHNDWDVAFEGKSRGNRHLNRVNKIVVFLAEKEKARRDICEAGGWLHDLGLTVGNVGHCFSGAKLARKYLTELGLDSSDVDAVEHCIEAHDGEVEARTAEAKVVHDADTIDKMGPFGFIRHVWKISLIYDKGPKQLVTSVQKHIAERWSNLYFSSSRDTVAEFVQSLDLFLADRDAAKEVVEIISRSSSQGRPSEIVAEDLVKDSTLDKGFRKSLQRQLSTDYLP